MSKKECEIVQDLLFIYNDGVASESSKQMVEEHLKTCTECKKMLTEIEQESKKEINKEKIDYLKKIKSNLNKKNIIIKIVSIILILIVLLALAVFIKYYDEASKMDIILDNNITNEQINEITNIIKSNCKNPKIVYNSQQDVYNKMMTNLIKNREDNIKDNENNDFLKGIDKNMFPPSIYVKTSIREIKNLENKLINIQGIKSIKRYIGVKISN